MHLYYDKSCKLLASYSKYSNAMLSIHWVVALEHIEEEQLALFALLKS